MTSTDSFAAEPEPDAWSIGALDPLDTYRRMFANAADGLSAWWYLGVSLLEVPGYPVIPVQHIETVMIYKTRTLSTDAFRMDWWEIGYMRDPVSGEIATTWVNPITGTVVEAPNRFEEGPAHFVFARNGSGLDVELTQAHARIESVQVAFTQKGDRILLEQTERKVRGFPLPDGSMPSLDSPNVSRARTQLSILSARADLSAPDAPSSGAYEFALDAPAWMGVAGLGGRCVVRGIMTKAPMNHRLNPTAWGRLQTLFPERFDGDDLRPNWL